MECDGSGEQFITIKSTKTKLFLKDCITKLFKFHCKITQQRDSRWEIIDSSVQCCFDDIDLTRCWECEWSIYTIDQCAAHCHRQMQSISKSSLKKRYDDNPTTNKQVNGYILYFVAIENPEHFNIDSSFLSPFISLTHSILLTFLTSTINIVGMRRDFLQLQPTNKVVRWLWLQLSIFLLFISLSLLLLKVIWRSFLFLL